MTLFEQHEGKIVAVPQCFFQCQVLNNISSRRFDSCIRDAWPDFAWICEGQDVLSGGSSGSSLATNKGTQATMHTDHAMEGNDAQDARHKDSPTTQMRTLPRGEPCATSTTTSKTTTTSSSTPSCTAIHPHPHKDIHARIPYIRTVCVNAYKYKQINT